MSIFNENLVKKLKTLVDDCNWQNVGHVKDFQARKCYKFQSIDEIDQDLVLIKLSNTKFHAMDARCSHEGGPLDEGEIEELHEKLVLVCPWHSFEFDLQTGESKSTGLRQQIYKIRIANDHVFINTPFTLKLEMKLNQNRDDEIVNTFETINLACNGNCDEESIVHWSVKVLCTADSMEKANLTNFILDKWNKSEIQIKYDDRHHNLPEQPYRTNDLKFVNASKIRRGKGGTLASRIALLHSLANIEQWAIDLSWDIIARFSHTTFPDGSRLPKQFFSDFIKVAADEAKHFILLEKRLKELESHFGALEIHNGLWESAVATKDSLLARLAIVHMVHEARGLDVHPQTRNRFLNQNDKGSVDLLEILYADEITHVACGLKWFEYTCAKYEQDPISSFHRIVKEYFKGYLKPPFNTQGRNIAGMDVQWYEPLVKK